MCRRPAFHTLTFLALASLLAAEGCASAPHPRETVKALNRDDPKYATARCERARAAARRWDDHNLIRSGVAIGGNLAAPFAGTAAAMALNKRLDRKRKRLAHEVAKACVSDPLGGAARSAAGAR